MHPFKKLLIGVALAVTLTPSIGRVGASAASDPSGSVAPLCASGTRVTSVELYNNNNTDLGEIVRYQSNCGDGHQWETAWSHVGNTRLFAQITNNAGATNKAIVQSGTNATTADLAGPGFTGCGAIRDSSGVSYSSCPNGAIQIVSGGGSLTTQQAIVKPVTVELAPLHTPWPSAPGPVPTA